MIEDREITTPKKAVLWGHGSFYRSRLGLIRAMEQTGQIKVTGITGKNPEGCSSFDGYPFTPREELAEHGHDVLFIMSSLYEKEIREEYLGLPGISGNRTVPGRVLDLPGFDLDRHLAVLALRPTIFSINCWGGCLYRTLGLECLSPFKNLWVPEKDYLRFLKDPEYYLGLVPEFERMEEGHNEGEEKEYPVLNLGGVRLFCDHYKTAEEAAGAWMRRKEKINRDHMLAMFYTESRESERQFYELPGYGRKVCFVPHADGDVRSVLLPRKRELYAYDVLETAAAETPVFDYYSFFFGDVKRL